MSWDPYRTSGKPSVPVETTKYPRLLAQDTRRRIVQTDENKFVVEDLVESADSLGSKVSTWARRTSIEPEAAGRWFAKEDPEVVLWIAQQLARLV